MKGNGSNYNNYIFVILTTISLCLFASPARSETGYLQDNYGPIANSPYNPAKFSYSKTAATYLTKFRTQLNKTEFDNAGNNILADVNIEYGRLFSPSNHGYSGFSYLSAKINSDNRIKVNTSLGHFIEAIDGELFFSYRLLGTNLNHTFTTSGNIDDRVYENSFSAGYTRYTDTFLRETSLNYNFSTIPGEEFYGATLLSQNNTQKSNVNVIGGYGATMTHEIGAQLAFGYEELGSGLITGLKTSFGVGYEYEIQEELYNYSEEMEESVSFLAAIQQKTPFGLINTSYKHLDSSQTLYAGYALSGLELYLKEVRYQDGKNNRLLGFLVKLDLWNPKDPFRKIKKLFGRNNSSNRGHEQMRHSVSLQSDSFSTQPKLKINIDS
ncbi:MAG: hypothetical protein ACI8ZB_004340 [Desulforhopalus sp.]|jgi:hypothetical protein